MRYVINRGFSYAVQMKPPRTEILLVFMNLQRWQAKKKLLCHFIMLPFFFYYLKALTLAIPSLLFGEICIDCYLEATALPLTRALIFGNPEWHLPGAFLAMPYKTKNHRLVHASVRRHTTCGSTESSLWTLRNKVCFFSIVEGGFSNNHVYRCQIPSLSS